MRGSADTNLTVAGVRSRCGIRISARSHHIGHSSTADQVINRTCGMLLNASWAARWQRVICADIPVKRVMPSDGNPRSFQIRDSKRWSLTATGVYVKTRLRPEDLCLVKQLSE
jgi:hypothetical protein